MQWWVGHVTRSCKGPIIVAFGSELQNVLVSGWYNGTSVGLRRRTSQTLDLLNKVDKGKRIAGMKSELQFVNQRKALLISNAFLGSRIDRGHWHAQTFICQRVIAVVESGSCEISQSHVTVVRAERMSPPPASIFSKMSTIKWRLFISIFYKIAGTHFQELPYQSSHSHI